MIKPSSISCPHCFARLDVPSGPPAASPARWLLLLLVSAAAFFAGWLANTNQDDNTTPGARATPARKAFTSSNVYEPKKSKVKRPQPATWEALLERASKDAGVPKIIEVPLHVQPELEKGSSYTFLMSVAQVGPDFILAAPPIPTYPARAVLQFEENALDNISVATGQLYTAVARFVGYRQVDLVSGASERYPVLEVIGMKNLNTSSFYSFD